MCIRVYVGAEGGSGVHFRERTRELPGGGRNVHYLGMDGGVVSD